MWSFEAVPVVVLYDNAPTVEPALRVRAIRALEAKLKEAGIRQLATASYPVGGPDDGYTVAMVVDADGESGSRVAALWASAIEESWC